MPQFDSGHFDGFANRGWGVGHFAKGPMKTDAVEVKWAWHDPGPAGSGWSNCKTATTLAILVEGHFKIEFKNAPKDSIELTRCGDYVVFEAGIPHRSTSVTRSLFLTIRWPSVLNDCEPFQERGHGDMRNDADA